jgi:hypothetical protein
MDDATITFVVLGVAVALFVVNRLPVGADRLGFERQLITRIFAFSNLKSVILHRRASATP